MPSQIFAKLGTIKGESTDAKHKDEIDLLGCHEFRERGRRRWGWRR